MLSFSCACRGLAGFTRVSTGFVFMPGDSPALHESGRILFYSSLTGLLGASPILAQGLPTQVAGVPLLVPLSQSLGFRPSLAKVTDFLCWLRSSKALSVSSVKGYHSMLSAVFRFHLPSLSSHPVIRDLLRSFCLAPAAPSFLGYVWGSSLP